MMHRDITYPRLASNSCHSWDWPWRTDPPASPESWDCRNAPQWKASVALKSLYSSHVLISRTIFVNSKTNYCCHPISRAPDPCPVSHTVIACSGWLFFFSMPRAPLLPCAGYLKVRLPSPQTLATALTHLLPAAHSQFRRVPSSSLISSPHASLPFLIEQPCERKTLFRVSRNFFQSTLIIIHTVRDLCTSQQSPPTPQTHRGILLHLPYSSLGSN